MASEREKEIVAYAVANPGLRQREVGKLLGITQSVVTSAFQRCGYSWKTKRPMTGEETEALAERIRKFVAGNESVTQSEVATALGCSVSSVSSALTKAGMAWGKGRKPKEHIDTMESSIESDTD